MTRRDKCHLIGLRAQRLTPAQASRAWAALAKRIEEFGDKDIPKFNDLLAAILKSLWDGRVK
jgi:hypothetical protein